MKNYKHNLLHRLKIIRGHFDRVIKMVDEDRYCIDILQQSTAVENALKQADQLILENHLRHCVKDALVNKTKAAEKVEEVIKVFKAKK